jgi:hypothetical protein
MSAVTKRPINEKTGLGGANKYPMYQGTYISEKNVCDPAISGKKKNISMQNRDKASLSPNTSKLFAPK